MTKTTTPTKPAAKTPGPKAVGNEPEVTETPEGAERAKLIAFTDRKKP